MPAPKSISLSNVPPVPDGLAGLDQPNGDAIYTSAGQRWRIRGDGSVRYFIRYDGNGAVEAAYDGRVGR